MHHFFVKEGQIGSETVTLTGPDVKHIKNVLRMKTGEKLLISNGVDRDYVCRLELITEESVTASICTVLEGGRELPARLYLFQGLPKGDKLELIIQKAVELGVFQIIPVVTKRTVVKLDRKKEEARLRRWNAIAESAAKQSKRMVIPEVTGTLSFPEALKLAKGLDLSVLPYELAKNMADTKTVFNAIRPGMSAGIIIGPEGGFEETEIGMAEEAGVKTVTLGSRILRTETAGLCVLSILMFLLEQ